MESDLDVLRAAAEEESGFDPAVDSPDVDTDVEAGPSPEAVRPESPPGGVSTPGMVKALAKVEPIVCRLLGPHWTLDPDERRTLAEAFTDAYPTLSLDGHERLLFWLLLSVTVLPRMPGTVAYILLKTGVGKSPRKSGGDNESSVNPPA